MALLWRALLIVCLLGNAATSAWAGVAHDRAHAAMAAQANAPCHDPAAPAGHDAAQRPDCCDHDRCDCGGVHVTAAVAAAPALRPTPPAPNPDDLPAIRFADADVRPPHPPPIG